MQGCFREHLLVKAETPAGARRAVERVRTADAPRRGVEERIDVDPVGMR
jgi:hypothetical protein